MRPINILIFVLVVAMGCGDSVKKQVRIFNRTYGAEVNASLLDGRISKKEYDFLKDLYRTKSNLPDSTFLDWLSEFNKDIVIDTSSCLEKIKIYVETSGSMKGYIDIGDRYPQGNWNFKIIVPELISNSIDSRDLELYTITDKPTIYLKDPRIEFRRELISGSIFSGASSELNSVFSQIIKSIQGDEISILVSDCILDFKGDMNNSTNKDIMASEIRQVLDEKEDFGAVVFQYLSDFNGSYYFNEKNELPFEGYKMRDRPFYIWVLGNKCSVEEFVGDNIIPKGFANYQAYGIFPIGLNKFELLPKVNKGRVSVQSFDEVVVRKSPPYTFVTALDVDSTYCYQTDANLSIKIEESYLDIHNSLVSKVELLEGYPRPMEKLQKKIFDGSFDGYISTTLEGHIQQEKGKETILHFSIPNPDWIGQSNIDTDYQYVANDMAKLEKKTFVLSTLSHAFHKSLTKSNMLEFKLKLTKR